MILSIIVAGCIVNIRIRDLPEICMYVIYRPNHFKINDGEVQTLPRSLIISNVTLTKEQLSEILATRLE